MTRVIVMSVFFFLQLLFVQSANVEPKVFNETIPFNFEKGIPIINVNIEGVSYRFLFDTGMPTAISKELIDQLKLSAAGKHGIAIDVNNTKKEKEYFKFNKISIANVDFNLPEILSIDFNSSITLKCLNVDGVFGNDLIKDAIWNINYVENTISFSNTIDSFKILKKAKYVKFNYSKKYKKYTPIVSITINNKKLKRVYFDTGSNSGFKMPYNYFSNTLDSKKSVTYFGINTFGVFGGGKNRKFVDSKVDKLKLGNVEIKNRIVTFDDFSHIIGNKFLKSYNVIINYNSKKIYLIKNSSTNNKEISNKFEFSYAVIKDKLRIIMIYKDSKAEKLLKLNDEIITINGISSSELLNSDICSVRTILKNKDTANIVILRNGKELKFDFKRKVVIE